MVVPNGIPESVATFRKSRHPLDLSVLPNSRGLLADNTVTSYMKQQVLPELTNPASTVGSPTSSAALPGLQPHFQHHPSPGGTFLPSTADPHAKANAKASASFPVHFHQSVDWQAANTPGLMSVNIMPVGEYQQPFPAANGSIRQRRPSMPAINDGGPVLPAAWPMGYDAAAGLVSAPYDGLMAQGMPISCQALGTDDYRHHFSPTNSHHLSPANSQHLGAANSHQYPGVHGMPACPPAYFDAPMPTHGCVTSPDSMQSQLTSSSMFTPVARLEAVVPSAAAVQLPVNWQVPLQLVPGSMPISPVAADSNTSSSVNPAMPVSSVAGFTSSSTAVNPATPMPSLPHNPDIWHSPVCNAAVSRMGLVQSAVMPPTAPAPASVMLPTMPHTPPVAAATSVMLPTMATAPAVLQGTVATAAPSIMSSPAHATTLNVMSTPNPAALPMASAAPLSAVAHPFPGSGGSAHLFPGSGGSAGYQTGLQSRQLNKVKLLVSSGGSFARDNITCQWGYLGGETRLVAVSQCGSLAELVDEMAKSSNLSVDETCCLKYELPGFPEVLVDLVDDEDVLNMWDEWIEYCLVDKPTYKLRLFVEYPGYPLQALVEGSTSTSQSSIAGYDSAGGVNGSAIPVAVPVSAQTLPGGAGSTGGSNGRSIVRASSGDTELSSEDVNAITETPRINLLDLEATLEIIAPSDLQVLRFLGAGAYGEVYLSKWHSNDVAVKCLSPSLFSESDFERTGNEQVVEDLIKEASILGSLRHPNIVWLYGIVLPEAKVHALNFLKGRLEPGQAIDAVTVLSDFTSGPVLSQMGCIRPPALVAEYMSAGSLRAAINRKAEFLRPLPVKIKIALDAARGMEYLHTKRIVHFDLKSGNLLVGFRERHVVAKVADFGLSKQRQRTYVTGVTSLRGTLPWTAPEIIKTPQAVNEKVDLYSFGVVLWELWTGREPFEGINYHALVHMLSMNDDVRPTIPGSADWEGDVPEEPATGWSNLMQQCWHREPGQRPTFTEVVQKLEEMRKEGKGRVAARERALSA